MKDEEFNAEQNEENVYSEEGREEYLESDEISAEEEAFMKGYEDAEDEEEKTEDEKPEDEESED